MTSPTGKAESTRGSPVPPHPEVQATGTRGRPDPCGEPRATPETTRTPAAGPAGRPPRPAPSQPRPRPPARRGHRGRPPASQRSPGLVPRAPASGAYLLLPAWLPTLHGTREGPATISLRSSSDGGSWLRARPPLGYPGRGGPRHKAEFRGARPLPPAGRVPEVTAHPGTGAHARTAPPPGPVEPIGGGLGRGLGGRAGRACARAGRGEGWGARAAQVWRTAFDELVLLFLLNRNGNEADSYPRRKQE